MPGYVGVGLVDGAPHPRREPVGAVRPAGVAGEPRAARRRLRGHGHLPAGQPSRTRAVRARSTGSRSTATRCAPPPAARSATCASTASALWHTLPAGARAAAARFDVVHACNPPDLLFLVALPLKRRGRAVRLRPARPGARAVPVPLRPRRGPALPRRARWLERLTYRAADVVIATNESYRARRASSRGGKAPERGLRRPQRARPRAGSAQVAAGRRAQAGQAAPARATSA